MHELALCQALLATVTRIAAAHEARAVSRVRLAIGPLSGAEPALLARAFDLARLGTIAAEARLDIVVRPARVACQSCRREFEVAANRLLCPACGAAEVRLIAGEDMILETLDLEIADPVADGAEKAADALPSRMAGAPDLAVARPTPG